MGRVIHVWPRAPRAVDGPEAMTEVAARSEWPIVWRKPWRRRRRDLAFRIPSGIPVSEVAAGDAFLLGTTFPAMRHGGVLHVHAPVTDELIGNLERLQARVVERRPEKYRRVEMRCERTTPPTPPPAPTLLSYSGGLDSTHALLRATSARAEADPAPGTTPRVAAAVMVAGADIPVGETAAFARAFERSRRIVESRGLPLLAASTNLRQLKHSWTDGYVAGLVAVLGLFRARYGSAVLSMGVTAEEAMRHWPQDLLDPPLVSTRSFSIVSEGGDLGRFEKMAAMDGWPEALEDLRVCYAGGVWDRNCGACFKCLTAMLFARILWKRPPPFLPREVTVEDVRSLLGSRDTMLRLRLEQVRRAAHARGIAEPWLDELDRAAR